MEGRLCQIAVALLVLARVGSAGAYELSGMVAFDSRLFLEEPAFPEQSSDAYYPSLVMQPEVRTDWSGEKNRFTFIPFLRLEHADSQRQHGDIRELNWMRVEDGWDMTVGVAKLFWGVTESRHLVDIINQTDLLEEIDQEQKLGQPMINLNLIRSYGAFSLFVLPYFREQSYENRQGRLRFALPIDTDHAHYDSARGARHTDVAVRWHHSQGSWDIGLAHFRGTSREAAFDFDLNNPVDPILVPRYDIINQTGLDIQYTSDAWLLKLETITRAGQGNRFTAVTTGFEYTMSDILKSGADLGLISEYNYDGRDGNPTVAPPVPFDNDLFFGLRLSMNDSHSSSVLAGILQDMEGGATFVNVEASRRFAQAWTIELQGRFFMDAAPDDFVFYGYHHDSYFQLRLARYF